VFSLWDEVGPAHLMDVGQLWVWERACVRRGWCGEPD